MGEVERRGEERNWRGCWSVKKKKKGKKREGGKVEGVKENENMWGSEK